MSYHSHGSGGGEMEHITPGHQDPGENTPSSYERGETDHKKLSNMPRGQLGGS